MDGSHHQGLPVAVNVCLAVASPALRTVSVWDPADLTAVATLPATRVLATGVVVVGAVAVMVASAFSFAISPNAGVALS